MVLGLCNFRFQWFRIHELYRLYTEEDRQDSYSKFTGGGRYPITEPVSVPSSIYSAGQQAEPIITHTVKPSHGVKRGRETEGARATLSPSTAGKVGPNEHPDRRLDELQLRDRCTEQLRGPTKEQTD